MALVYTVFTAESQYYVKKFRKKSIGNYQADLEIWSKYSEKNYSNVKTLTSSTIIPKTNIPAFTQIEKIQINNINGILCLSF